MLVIQLRDGIMNKSCPFYSSILTAVLVAGSLFFASEAALADVVNATWGAPVKGLQLSISKPDPNPVPVGLDGNDISASTKKVIVNGKETFPTTTDYFQVAVNIRNVGDKDTILNLGFTLGDGKGYPDNVSLILIDAAGKQTECKLLWADAVAGSVGPLNVTLGKGKTYSFQRRFRRPDTVASGNYQLKAKFIGTSKTEDGDGSEPGVPIDKFWIGSAESNSVPLTLLMGRYW
jgi:hypothetical protein